MITALTSPQYVNRIRQDWTANGGVYGDGGVYMATPANNPFAQLGPTLDLVFAGTATDPLDVASTTDDTLSLNFTAEAYQIAAQYAVWGTGGLQAVNFADIVTFTRASTGTFFDFTGTLQTAAINAPRFDFNPSTLAAQGLLIEEARTNSIRNNTMQGAVAGTPGTLPTNWNVSGLGTLTQQVVGTGTVNGITYIDIRFSGTTSTTQLTIRFEPNGTGGIPAANGQTWAASQWSAVIAGSLSNITGSGINANLWDAAGSFVGGALLVPINTTATLTRLSGAGTIATAGTAFIQPQIYLTFSSGVAIDITLRIGLPQLEQGAFATSVIPTTTTALTRSADAASVNTLSPWFNSTASTLYAEWTNIASAIPTGVTQIVAEIVEITGSNFYRIFQSQGAGVKASTNMFSGGVNPGRIDAGGAYSNATVKAASAFAASDRALAANGGAAVTSATGALPVGVTTLALGSSFGVNNFLNGYLRRITYYPRRLPNADLQTITA